MKNRMSIGCVALILIATITFQPAMLWAADSKESIYNLAEDDMNQLEKGIINLEKFMGEPWYKRHMGKLIAGTAIVVGGIAIVCSGGLAAPAAGVAASHFAATGGALSAAAAASAAATASAGLYVDSKGNIVIPEEKRSAVLDFYRANYSSWVNNSSTKKEYGETAVREIAQFLENNK